MDWLKELLKAQGVSEDKITSIVEGVEGNYKGWVPEHRFKEVNEGKKQAEKDVLDRDKQIADLGKAAGMSEELKKQIETLQSENKAAKEQSEADMKALRLDTALKLALGGQVHDADYAIGLLDKTKIELNEDGSVKGGLEDQVKALSESKAFLFVQKDDGKPAFKGAKPAEGTPGGQGKDDKPSYGKQAAANKSNNTEALEKVRNSYFEQ